MGRGTFIVGDPQITLMKKIILILALLMIPGLVQAQVPTTQYTQVQWDDGPTTPGSCTIPGFFYNSTLNMLLVCRLDSTQRGHFTLLLEPPTGTFAQLPVATGAITTFTVTDCLTLTCQTGGGVFTITLTSNGISWIAPVPTSTATVTLSAAQINTMFTTPVLLIPAQGAGTIINIQKCIYNAIFGSAAFTGGGAIGAFYGPTSPPVSLAGNLIVAATLTTFSANQIATPNPGFAANTGPYLNTGVYISNQTGVFAGGAGSSMVVSCQYSVTTGLQ